MSGNDTGFVGSIPQLYDRHMGLLMFQPFAEDMAARLGGMARGRVLETAAGTGIVTAALAAALPAAVEIVATDLNQPMLDHARSKPGMERVAFRQADALALPYGDASFDVVVCQFGVMFFPDRAQGFREARRVLKPGGRLLFSVWGARAEFPIMDAALEGLERRYPGHGPWFMERAPMGYHDPAAIGADLRAGGFAEHRVEVLRKTGTAPDAHSAAVGMCQGSPMRMEIEARDPGGLEAATAAAAEGIARRCGAGPIETVLPALVVEAQR